MRPLPEHRRLMLVQSLLAGESVRKVAARVGIGPDMVSRFLLEAGAACREFHDRTVLGLSVESLHCTRVWGFSYIHRRNAYMPEISRGIPRGGWAWAAHHAGSGMVVDWAVSAGDGLAAEAFIRRVRKRLSTPMAVRVLERDILLERGSPETGETALLSRLFGRDRREDGNEAGRDALAAAGDFRRRCLNLELALAFHFTCHNFLADAARTPPAVRLGLVARGWPVDTLLAMGAHEMIP